MKVQENTNGQLFISIPKHLANAKDFEKGQVLEWKVNDNGNLVLVD